MGNVPPPGPDKPEDPSGSGQPDWGEMKGKITGATGPDRLILIAGVVFFVSSFLPWYGVSVFNVSGWNTGGLAVISILFAIAATVFALIRILGVTLNLGAINDGVVYLALGGGAFLFVLLRLVTQTNFTKFGLYIALVSGGVLAFGGWQKFNALKR